jgi:hypothetical protein
MLPPYAGAEAKRSFVERNGTTHVAVLASDTARRRQVNFLHARLVGRVRVRPIRSRTRDERGPTKVMLVYAVEKR